MDKRLADIKHGANFIKDRAARVVVCSLLEVIADMQATPEPTAPKKRTQTKRGKK